MNHQNINHPNNQPMREYIEAVIRQQPDDAKSDVAQRNLIRRLDAERQAAKNRSFGWSWGWSSAAAAIVLLPLLLWMPGPNNALAFADVQRFFTSFETLSARLTTTLNDAEVLAMTIRVDQHDRARLDTGGGFSYVIDPNRSMMLQLFHEQKIAMLVPLNTPDASTSDTGLEWLADIREFTGKAELLDQTIEIRGRQAYGFRLSAGGMDMTLWADESGEPLRLQMQPDGPVGPSRIETRLDFEFDQPLDEALFSLNPPVGYQAPDPAGTETPLD